MAKLHYHVGVNMAGYLPEGDVFTTDDFASAKQMLIDELKRDEDNAEDEDHATELCHTAEDVNLWSGPSSVLVSFRSGYLAYWINECSEADCESAEEGE